MAYIEDAASSLNRYRFTAHPTISGLWCACDHHHLDMASGRVVLTRIATSLVDDNCNGDRLKCEFETHPRNGQSYSCTTWYTTNQGPSNHETIEFG